MSKSGLSDPEETYSEGSEPDLEQSCERLHARDHHTFAPGPVLERPALVTPPDHHLVHQGETLYSIAELYQQTPDGLWGHGENRSLAARRDPSLLRPGDRIFIPALQSRWEDTTCGHAHQFQLVEKTVWLRLVLEDDGGRPRAGLDYTLRVDSLEERIEGTTQADGLVEAQIPPSSSSGVLVIKEDGEPDEELQLFLGHLNPKGDDHTVEAILSNLGYGSPTVGDLEDEYTRSMVKMFQLEEDLDPTGVVDAELAALLWQRFSAK